MASAAARARKWLLAKVGKGWGGTMPSQPFSLALIDHRSTGNTPSLALCRGSTLELATAIDGRGETRC